MADGLLRHCLGRCLLAAALALPAAAPVVAAPPAPLQVLLLDSLPLDLPGHGRRNRLELSDLAWDPAGGDVWAVSDRGWLHRLRVEIEHGRLVAVHELSRLPLDGRPNLEALALRPGAVPLLAVDEARRQWLEIDPAGTVVARHALPPALPVQDRHSVEAMAWHPRHGVLLVAQKSGSAGEHRILGTTGADWRLPALPGAQIRAMGWMADGRLLLLERRRVDGPVSFHLRAISLDGCDIGGRCVSADVALPGAGAVDHLEGLACRGMHCLLVTDDGGAAPVRTRLLLLELVTAGR